MKHYIATLCFFVFISASAQVDSRIAPLEIDLERISQLEMEPLNNKQLYKDEMAKRKKGRANHFAHNFQVNKSSEEIGTWTTLDDGSMVWRLRVTSNKARSLNLGFSQYNMPRGGSMIIYTPDLETILGPFTPSDNEEHEQLWTPVIDGDDLIIEVWLKENKRSELALELKAVNHDFIGINSPSYMSGSCNLDVICNEDDGWEIVDGFRDIIQSVAFMHLNGFANCTGFLVNNTSQDCTPLFMTADHCGMSAGNAPSLVTYWNFQSPVCRQPGSGASGGNGNGVLDDYNSGSTLRATWAGSDFTIVELDDEISPTANAFRAGWNAEETMATSAIAVHHPNNDEKRISFEMDPLYLGEWGSGADNIPTGNHVIVPDWDIGTTEPGSSGSPLFDQDKRVIGQLHGGAAACGNDDYDSYGWFNASWDGGGQANTRLRDWIDPMDTGIMTVPGKDCGFSINAENLFVQSCAPDAAMYQLEITENFANDVNLTIDDLPTGLEAVFSDTSPAPGDMVTLIFSNTGNLAAGEYLITVDGTDGIESTSTTLTLDLFVDIPDAAAAVSPADNSTNITTNPNLVWSDAGATEYEIELALDANFTNIVASAQGVDQNEWLISDPLDALTGYFWHVRGSNTCGDSPWSETFSFMTANIVCAQNSAVVNSIPISPDGNVVITSTLDIPFDGEISDINVVRVEGNHTWIADLTFILESPEGTSVILLAEECGNEDNFNISFDDQASGGFPCPYNDGQSYPPTGALSTFNGENPQGTWTLTIEDNADLDGGSLEDWGLEICTVPSNAVTVTASQSNFTMCPSDVADFMVSIGGGFEDPVSVSIASSNPDIQLDAGPVDPEPGASIPYVVGASPGIGAGDYTADITVSDAINSVSTTINITVLDPPGVVGLTSPADDAVNVDVAPLFTWINPGNLTSIEIQISEDENFLDATTQSADLDPEATQHSFGDSFLPETVYYWQVIMTNICGSRSSTVISFETETGSGIGDLNNRSFEIIPNPTQGQVVLNLAETFGEELKGEIYHISGKLLGRFNIAAGQESYELNLSTFPTGIYFVRLRHDDFIATNKVVLN